MGHREQLRAARVEDFNSLFDQRLVAGPHRLRCPVLLAVDPGRAG